MANRKGVVLNEGKITKNDFAAEKANVKVRKKWDGRVFCLHTEENKLFCILHFPTSFQHTQKSKLKDISFFCWKYLLHFYLHSLLFGRLLCAYIMK